MGALIHGVSSGGGSVGTNGRKDIRACESWSSPVFWGAGLSPGAVPVCIAYKKGSRLGRPAARIHGASLKGFFKGAKQGGFQNYCPEGSVISDRLNFKVAKN